MFATRFHGRGGQGVVTAAELLSVAAFVEGRHAQAFPTFGSERTGAPVVSFCRIDDTADPSARADRRARTPLIVQDPTLLHQVDVFDGPPTDGYLLVNTTRSVRRARARERGRAVPPGQALTLPATEIAREHLGRPLPNAALLGAFAALTGRCRMRLARGGDPRAVRSGAMGRATWLPPRPRFDLIAERIREAANA